MNDARRIWVWVGVGVVVVIVIVWIVWAMTAKPVVSVPPPVYAPQGQLVPQFPKSLILDSNAAISGSYSISYSTSTNQYTAEYDSTSSMAALYGEYQSYLPQNNWTVTGSLTTHPTFRVITASQGSDQLQVVISAIGKGSQATITYVVP